MDGRKDGRPGTCLCFKPTGLLTARLLTLELVMKKSTPRDTGNTYNGTETLGYKCYRVNTEEK